MSSVQPALKARGLRGNQAREASAFIAGIALPVAMVLSNRSSIAVLACAALVALAGLYADGRLTQLRDFLRGGLASAPLICLTIFWLYLALSLGWTHFPLAGATAFGEFSIALAAALLVGAAWRIAPPQGIGRALAIGLLLASAMTIADLRSDMWLRRLLQIRPNSFVLNRTVVSLLVLVAPMLLLTWQRDRWLGLGAAVLVLAAIGCSESGAAALGALAWLGMALAAVIAPAAATAALAAGTLLVLAVSPWIGPLLDKVLPVTVHAALESAHSKDRVDIWRSFGAAVQERPWFGSGFNASTRMADDPVAAMVAEPNRVLLGSGHPHNALLQIWVEGGVIGAMLFALLVLVMAKVLWTLRGPVRIATLACAGACLSIAAVSHGAWQGWWIAMVGLAIVLLMQDVKEGGHG